MNKQKILVVEDDTFLSELLVNRLVKDGFMLELAVDGESALISVRKEPPAIILLDIVLPGIDGYEVLRQLKKDPSLQKIPVLILSNLGQKDEVEQGLRLGAQEFLVKAQLDLDSIAKKVKIALGA